RLRLGAAGAGLQGVRSANGWSGVNHQPHVPDRGYHARHLRAAGDGRHQHFTTQTERSQEEHGDRILVLKRLLAAERRNSTSCKQSPRAPHPSSSLASAGPGAQQMGSYFSLMTGTSTSGGSGVGTRPRPPAGMFRAQVTVTLIDISCSPTAMGGAEGLSLA